MELYAYIFVVYVNNSIFSQKQKHQNTPPENLFFLEWFVVYVNNSISFVTVSNNKYVRAIWDCMELINQDIIKEFLEFYMLYSKLPISSFYISPVMYSCNSLQFSLCFFTLSLNFFYLIYVLLFLTKFSLFLNHPQDKVV